PRFRLSIAGMLGVVAVVALWLTSLRVASPFSVSVAATITLGLLLTGVLGALLLRGPGRGFWLGFALFGGVYLLLVLWDWVGGPLGHDLTTGLRDLAESLLPPDPTLAAAGRAMTARPNSSAPLPGLPPGFNYFAAVQQREAKLGNFVEIGRMSLSLLFG